ncbi:hypothetical protein RND81_13G005700 [Saponaria officinalis]|uniref:Secreted protein n=1 Tax=Saponaria officinalis TaxID=3572 RepID=A0AAW1GSD5_SAPOF
MKGALAWQVTILIKITLFRCLGGDGTVILPGSPPNCVRVSLSSFSAPLPLRFSSKYPITAPSRLSEATYISTDHLREFRNQLPPLRLQLSIQKTVFPESMLVGSNIKSS